MAETTPQTESPRVLPHSIHAVGKPRAREVRGGGGEKEWGASWQCISTFWQYGHHAAVSL